MINFSNTSLFVLTGLPNRPGTPEIPQKYNNTALVLWRPSDTLAPCTYSLQRRAEGQCLQTIIISVLLIILDVYCQMTFCYYYYNIFHCSFWKGYIDASIMGSLSTCCDLPIVFGFYLKATEKTSTSFPNQLWPHVFQFAIHLLLSKKLIISVIFMKIKSTRPHK